MNHNTFADLLATVESVIGDRPKNSIVIAAFTEEARLVATLLIEITEEALAEKNLGIEPTHLLGIAQNMTQVDHQCFTILAYVDREPDCNDHPAMFHQTQYIAGFLEMLTGREAVAAGLITSEFFMEFDDDGPASEDEEYTASDWKRHPVSEIDESVKALELKAAGMYDVFPSPLEPTAATKEVSAAIDSAFKSFPFLNNWEPGHVEGAKARALFETCLARDFGPTEPEATELLGYLQHPGIRDRLVADVVSTADDYETYIRALTGKLEVTVSRSRMNNALGLFLNLTQYAEGERRHPLLLALSILSWFKGSAHHAGKYAQILADDIPEDKSVKLWMRKLSSASLAKCALQQQTD